MFIDELLEKVGIEQASCPFFCVGFGNQAICIQGKLKILQFTSTKIILQIAKEKIYIYGNNLQLFGLEKTELTICGTIVAVSSKEVQIV